MTKQKQELCEKRENLVNTLATLDAEKDGAQYDDILAKIEEVDAAIDRLEKAESVAKQSATAAGNAAPADDKKKFKNFAEQLKAVVNAAKTKGRNVDPRLISDDIKGVNTETDADGGYAVQSDFLGNILDRAFERSQIISRCRQYTVSANSNRVNYVQLDDSNDASTSGGVVVAGGVQAYWAEEGGTVTPSKPKFKSTEIKLGKAMGLAYVTEEAMEDMPFLSQTLEDSFSDAVAGLLTNGILNGEGELAENGRQPTGVLGSNAVVTVTPADSTKLTYADFLNMKAAMRKKDWANAAWFVHPDLEAILPTLADANGNQVFMPAGGISGAQYDTILGRPVIYDEFMAAKDSKGDILLANFDQYMLIRKGEERKEWSMHVEFLTDQQCFRIVMRVSGAPVNNTTYAVRNSTSKRASFVTLNTRTAGG